MENGKEPDVNKKKNRSVYFCVAYSHYLSTSIHRVINRLKKYFNLSWLIVIMSHHIINSLAELFNGYLAAKTGRGILSKDLINRECNCSIPYKVNGKCFYKGKFWSKCLIHKIKCSMCDDIYIGKTQQTHTKRMDDHFSNILCLLKNGQKMSLISVRS